MTEEIVTGRDVTIRFDGHRCIHSRMCVLGHPEVFVPNVKGAWIDPDAARAEAVMHVALACPSGRSGYRATMARPPPTRRPR